MQIWKFSGAVLGLVIMAIIACGCVGEAAEPRQTATPTPIPLATITAATETTRPMECHRDGDAVICLYTDLTTVTTAVPTWVQPEPEEIASPLESPVTLSGVGNEMVWFDTVAPGMVTFRIKYGGPQYVKNCEEKRLMVMLAGASIDTTLVSTGSGSYKTLTKTFNLLSPGRYSLSVKGCYEWQITVS